MTTAAIKIRLRPLRLRGVTIGDLTPAACLYGLAIVVTPVREETAVAS